MAAVDATYCTPDVQMSVMMLMRAATPFNMEGISFSATSYFSRILDLSVFRVGHSNVVIQVLPQTIDNRNPNLL